MEFLIKLITVAAIGACMSLILKKDHPELSFLLGICTALFSMFRLFDIYNEVMRAIEHWKDMISLSGEYFLPLMKCFGISIVSQFGVNLCRDAGQAAVAGVLELCGNMAAIWCILPLINHLLRFVEELLL